MLVFGFFALNYGNTLRWQIRAQNTADSAAQAILSLQTQEFNAMNAALYAASIEEYRIRALLNGMVLASHQQGGCGNLTDCSSVENQLESKYDQAVSRYTDDVKTLQRVTATLTYGNVKNDAKALLSRIENCSAPMDAAECGVFHYGALVIQQRADTQYVDMDAKRVIRPYVGVTTGLSLSRLFAPVQVEVSVCAVVKSLVPSFYNWQFAPFHAMARGAATAVMVEEDWLQPGTLLNLYTALPYQPKEQQQTVTGAFNSFYDLDFGGNSNVVVPGQGYGSTIGTTGFYSVYLGWWNSIPIHPFSGSKPSPAALGCTS